MATATITTTESGKFSVSSIIDPDAKPLEFDTEEQAANAINAEISRLFLASMTGGKKYASAALAARLVSSAISESLSNVKPKDRDGKAMSDAADKVSEEDFREVLRLAVALVEGRRHLATTKYQATMKGTAKPSKVAEAFCNWLAPIGSAAQKKQSADYVAGSI
jgi:hypothetical protein